MPDFERRSRASFISSNDGGTPASFSRSWMKRSSSNCLRVSIGSFPPVFSTHHRSKTNHERTLYVLSLFRNPLIWREQVEGPLKRSRKPKDGTAAAGRSGRLKWRANQETVCICEDCHHRGILRSGRCHDRSSVGAGRERRPQIIRPFVVFGQRHGERGWF